MGGGGVDAVPDAIPLFAAVAHSATLAPMQTLEFKLKHPRLIVRMLTDRSPSRRGQTLLMNAKVLLPACLTLLVAGLPASAQSGGRPADAAGYSLYQSWSDMDKAADVMYATVIRVSGAKGYTGFWFFGAEQFDASHRYAPHRQLELPLDSTLPLRTQRQRESRIRHH